MNPLLDVMSPKARKWVYAVLSLAMLVVGVWQLADGNWTVFLVQLVGSLTHAMANANTNPQDPQP